jgi:acetaldehyde dehydrogenase
VQAYVPGYRLKQEVQFERYGDNNKLKIPGRGEFTGIRTMILLEVEGAGDYLPSYSGNLDIMTAAAKATGELLAQRILAGKKVAARAPRRTIASMSKPATSSTSRTSPCATGCMLSAT